MQKHSEVQLNHSSLQTFFLWWLYQNITNASTEKNTKCLLETHHFHLSLYALTIKSFVAISANDTWQKKSIKVFIERENTGDRFSVNNVRTGSMMSVCVQVYTMIIRVWGWTFLAVESAQYFLFFFISFTHHGSPPCAPHPPLFSLLSNIQIKSSLLVLYISLMRLPLPPPLLLLRANEHRLSGVCLLSLREYCKHFWTNDAASLLHMSPCWAFNIMIDKNIWAAHRFGPYLTISIHFWIVIKFGPDIHVF